MELCIFTELAISPTLYLSVYDYPSLFKHNINHLILNKIIIIVYCCLTRDWLLWYVWTRGDSKCTRGDGKGARGYGKDARGDGNTDNNIYLNYNIQCTYRYEFSGLTITYIYNN